MIDTEDIVQRITAIYEGQGGVGADVPLALQAVELASFAREYIAAARIVETEGPQLFLARLQMTGQAVELALKACSAAAGIQPQSGHDLIQLYRDVEAQGFELDALAFAAIVHLHHFYFKDLATQTKFKARYPTRRDERLGGAVPVNAVFTQVVESLLVQASRRSPIQTAAQPAVAADGCTP